MPGRARSRRPTGTTARGAGPARGNRSITRMDEEGRAAVLVACHGCGEVYRVPELPEGGTAACPRCGGTLFRHRTASIERALALNLAALALFGVANLYPLMTMTIAGREQATTLLEGSVALWRTRMEGLAALVFLVAILIPLLWILGSLRVLGLARLGRRQAPVFRLVHLFHPWAMAEVYLLGLIVAWVKLKDLAQVHLGLGIVAFVGLIVVMVWAEAALEPHEVWERVQPQRRAPAGGDLGDGDYLGCHACGQLVPDGDGHGPCPRRGAALPRRKPGSPAPTR